MDTTPAPKNPTQTLVPAASPLDATRMSIFSVPAVDLSSEALLRLAPRTSFNGLTAPTLGGIPLLAKLGQGGMGAVYFGIHSRLMLEVAVKVLPFQLADQDPTLIQRFFREAQIAAKVKSKHLVSVLDVNQDAGLFYLVMEYVSGVTAGQHCRKCMSENGCAGLDEATALDICIAATEGLAAAHADGVIHRDVKPENILLPLDKNSRELRYADAKLADLGLAREDSTVQSLTAAQNVMGTPGYMSPEQASDTKNAMKPADIFSMGATLYALLCGRSPFSGETSLETILNTIQKPHRPLANYRKDVSLETVALIDRCLAKRADRRPADATSLLTLLQACRARVTKRPSPPRVDATAVRQIEETLDPRMALQVGELPPESSSQQPYVRTHRGSRGSWVFLIIGAAMLAGGGLWLAHDNQLKEQARLEEEQHKQHLLDEEASIKKQDLELKAKNEREAAERAWQDEIHAKVAKALKAGEEAKVKSNESQAAPEASRPPADVVQKTNPGNIEIKLNDKQATPPPQQTALALPENLKRLMEKLNLASEAVEKAATAQRQAAEQVNKLSDKRRDAADTFNRMVKEFETSHSDRMRPPPPPGGRGKPQPRPDEGADADIRKQQDAIKTAHDEFDAIEKTLNDAMATYDTLNLELSRKIEIRAKLERELTTAAGESHVPLTVPQPPPAK